MNKIHQALLSGTALALFSLGLTAVFVDIKSEVNKFQETKKKIQVKLNNVPSEETIIKNLKIEKPKEEFKINTEDLWKVKKLEVIEEPTSKPAATSQPSSRPTSQPANP